MPFSDPILVHQIRRDEGRSAVVYKDSLGWWTIGDGILVDFRKPGAGLRPEEMDFITENRVRIAAEEAMAIVGPGSWAGLSPPIRRACANMCYNMGAHEFAKFDRTLILIRKGFFEDAAEHLTHTPWYKQVGDRAKRICEQIRTGVDQ